MPDKVWDDIQKLQPLELKTNDVGGFRYLKSPRSSLRWSLEMDK